MTQVKRRAGAAQELAATKSRTLRTFLLMQQFAAKEIGERIAQARKERGLSQEQLADLAAGFSKRSLQDYESGVTIPYKHLRELSRLLRRPEEWFLYGEEETDALPERQLQELQAQVAALREDVRRLLSHWPEAAPRAREESA